MSLSSSSFGFCFIKGTSSGGTGYPWTTRNSDSSSISSDGSSDGSSSSISSISSISDGSSDDSSDDGSDTNVGYLFKFFK